MQRHHNGRRRQTREPSIKSKIEKHKKINIAIAPIILANPDAHPVPTVEEARRLMGGGGSQPEGDAEFSGGGVS